MTLPISKLRFYSLGTVTKDKAPGSVEVIVSPTEQLPQLNAKIRSFKKEHNITAPDVNDVSRKVKVKGGGELVAKWLPLGVSNRITAPDVCAGETVILLQFADVPEYYWTTLFREPALRKVESVLYAISNIAKGIYDKAFNKATSYWMYWSTSDKIIQLHTAKNDGELAEYDIIIDTKKGYVHIKDDMGNELKLDSANGRVGFKSTKDILLNTRKVYVTNDLVVGGNILANGISAKSMKSSGSGSFASLSSNQPMVAPDFVRGGVEMPVVKDEKINVY